MASVLPEFVAEMAFGNGPGDASLTWTDISDYLRGFHISRGRQYELNQSQAGTCDITLKNTDRRFDPTYTGSPYYPNVLPMVPVRLRSPGVSPLDDTLTVSGNEITDATRAAALLWQTGTSGGMTDGETAPAGVGIHRAATNLFRRGQCDATTDWNGDGTATRSIDSSVPAPFSPQSILVACDGLGAAQGVDCFSGTGLAAAAGTVGVGSAYVKGVAGQQYTVGLVWGNTDAGVTIGTTTTFTASGAWQLVSAPSLAVAATKTGDRLRLQVRINGTRAETFHVAHAMLEKGQSVVAPYVPTSGGSTATHSAARVQADATLLDETQCAVAFRIAYGFASTVSRSNPRYLFDWRDDANNLLGLWLDTANKWNAGRETGGAGSPAVSAAQTFAADGEATVIFACDSGHVKVSVNGGAFTSVANTSVPTLAATLFDIGSQAGATQFDGRVLWAATFTGTLADQDAATIAAIPDSPVLNGTIYTNDASRLLWPAGSKVTAYWQAVDDGYRTANDAILFTGYVERYPQNRTGPTYAETVVQAVDGFELLTNTVLPADTYPSELSGTRVGRILDAASWSTSARDIATGQSTISAYTFTDADLVQPLQHLQDVADSEIGAFYITGDGRATFLDRHSSFGSVSQGTFSDKPAIDTGSVGYSDIQASLDKDLITNDWRGQRSGGSVMEAIDPTSVASYFQRTQSRTPLLTSDSDVLNQMEYLLSLYKNPALRVSQITVTPGSSGLAWVHVLARELSDRISVKAHPPGGGDALNQDAYIQNIDLTVSTDAAGAKLVWSLLPAATQGFWRASYSQASIDTRAGY